MLLDWFSCQRTSACPPSLRDRSLRPRGPGSTPPRPGDLLRQRLGAASGEAFVEALLSSTRTSLPRNRGGAHRKVARRGRRSGGEGSCSSSELPGRPPRSGFARWATAVPCLRRSSRPTWRGCALLCVLDSTDGPQSLGSRTCRAGGQDRYRRKTGIPRAIPAENAARNSAFNPNYGGNRPWCFV